MNYLLENVITNLAASAIGFILGYITRGIVNQKEQRPPIESDRLVLLSVTTVWVLSFLITIISPQYETPSAIHGLMVMIVGFFYRGSVGDIMKRRKDNDPKNN